METQRKASALSCSLSTTSCFPLGPALMRDHVFLENESNKSLFSMEFTLCVIRQSPVQTKRLKPSGGKETDLESSISRGKLAVMSARLSSGNVLGAQRVLRTQACVSLSQKRRFGCSCAVPSPFCQLPPNACLSCVLDWGAYC